MRIRKDSDERFPRFSYATRAVFTDKTCFMATGQDLLFALAVLNSKVGRYQFMQTVSMMDNGGYLMQKIYVEQIRLPNIEKSEQTKLSTAVKPIVGGKTNEAVERAIDEAVATLFGLSKSECDYLDSLFRHTQVRG